MSKLEPNGPRQPQLSRRQLLRGAGLGGAALFAAPALGALLDACGPGTPSDAAIFALGTEPEVLNPVISTLAVESGVMSVIFPGLLEMTKDGRGFVPNLAQSHSVSDGGLGYSFTLLPNLRWDDGEPLTSDDWRFTWELYVKEGSEGWSNIDSVETPDERTVNLHLKEPFAPLLLGIASGAYQGGGPILPRHALEKDAKNLQHASFNRHPVGCGPFRFKLWQTAQQIVFEANPHYHKGRPKLDQIVFKIVPDPDTQLNDMHAGEIDVIGPSAQQWSQAKGMSGTSTLAYDDLTYTYIQLDQWNLLKDVRVRQALEYATPRQQIVTGIMRGLAEVAYADCPPTSAFSNPDIPHRAYDPSKAKELLEEAGFTMQNGVMVRDGQKLQVPIYTLNNSPSLAQVGQILQSEWTKIGVETGNVVTQDPATLFGQSGPQWNGKDAALIFSWGQGADPDDFINWNSTQIPANATSPGGNDGRFTNAEVDQLTVKGEQTVDFTARKAVYDRLQYVLDDQVAAIFLFWAKTLYAYNSKLQNFEPDAFRGPFWNINDWSKG